MNKVTPFWDTMFGAPVPIQESPTTVAWTMFPFRYSLGVSDQIMTQPRNLVLKQTNIVGIQQVLSSAAFGQIPVANLVVPQIAQIRASTVQGWLVQQLLRSQNKLPGRP